jgi:hypothetical protein
MGLPPARYLSLALTIDDGTGHLDIFLTGHEDQNITLRTRQMDL